MQNYNQLMEGVIADLNKNEKRAKLLLHSCCAPCSSACIERLKDAFDLTIYYYNPNIDTISEYNARKEEQQRLCKELQINCIVGGIHEKLSGGRESLNLSYESGVKNLR